MFIQFFFRAVNMFQSIFLLSSSCYKSKMSNKITCHPFLYIFYINTGFAAHHLCLCEFEIHNAIQNNRWGGKWETIIIPSRPFLFCYSWHKSTPAYTQHGPPVQTSVTLQTFWASKSPTPKVQIFLRSSCFSHYEDRYTLHSPAHQ